MSSASSHSSLPAAAAGPGRAAVTRLGTDTSGSERSARPIGIFDSGVGGLTVARAVIDQLPNESILYVGDTANGPYGPLPIAEVRANALGVMDELVDSGVKLLVIACNSASAAVLRDARERYTARYGIPVIEVIQPAVRRAVAATRTGRVGVIGTSATIGSRAYEDTFAAAPALQITSVACPDFVEFVESGITAGAQLLSTAQGYLAGLKAADVDTLVLGCTHYPLLTGVISFCMGDGVTLVSSAEETAKDVYRALVSHDLERTAAAAPVHNFLATGDAGAFEVLARRFLGPEVLSVEQVDHVAAHYPTGSMARVSPEMLAAARSPARPWTSNAGLAGSVYAGGVKAGGAYTGGVHNGGGAGEQP
ncbi:glutamate racemase [Paenarthrobacter sp. PH39-S1]|uniref:glutamate racemase n=1 Tax=Paenarthrobacter sp. PH39-S1 TaxID=3046204 RepID=UPI0024BA78ED|nr:glutamate racemase [Paenarthrobacter sp. PH39-S1]MDJ0357176.1 glutamate racemase [Paenarthrobacter sp. PH39-S1]